MSDSKYLITVQTEDESKAGRKATELQASIAQLEDITSVDREKSDDRTMDIGNLLSVVITSGGSIALAKGIADWLRSQRGVSVTVEKLDGSKSIKATISGVDNKTAEAFIDIMRTM